MCNNDKFTPDQLKPNLPTTASGVTRQRTYGNYNIAGLRENKGKKRGGRRVKRNEGTVEMETHSHKGGYLKHRNNH